MNNELKIKIGFILFLIALSGYALWPSVERYSMDREEFEKLRQTDPQRYADLNEKALHLGLDLQGGMHLVLGVRTEEVLEKELEGLVNDVKDWLGQDQIPFLAAHKTDNILEVAFSRSEDLDKGQDRLSRALGDGFTLTSRAEESRQVLMIQAVPDYVRRIQEDAFNQMMETLRNRVDQLGVAEPTIQRQGLAGHRILIQLPGLKDPDQAKRVIGKVAALDFRIVLTSSSTKESLMGRYPGGCPDHDPADGKEVYTCSDQTLILPGEMPSFSEQTQRGYYHMEGNIPASGRDLESASVGTDQYGKPSVQFKIKPASSEAFGRLTRENLGKQMAIILDGQVKSAPTLQGRITRDGEITGSFTPKESYELALTLRSGALPASVEILEERSVGASLGDDSIRQGRNAFIAATLFVILFMVAYYRINGVNAILSLGIGMLLVMAALAFSGATLTLPGIAGLVLTVGMGVDANVLIFERMRDEMRLGRTIRSSVAAGFEKAFSAIADSNITTLLAAVLLFQFGTGPVRGFAVTLVFGVIATVFAAIFVSHVLFDLQLQVWPNFKMRFGNILHWLRLPDPPHIDFFGPHRKALGASAALTVLGIALLGLNGLRHGSILNWGIDFSGGSLLQIHFEKPVDISEVRAVAEQAGFDPTIQQFGDATEFLIRTMDPEATVAESKSQFLQKIRQELKLAFELDPQASHAEILLVPGPDVKTEDIKSAVEALKLGENARVSIEEGKVRVRISEVTERILQALKSRFEGGGLAPEKGGAAAEANRVTERRTETVGAQVGEELKTSALIALALGLLAQLIYITVRFEFRYALGAIVALFHDVFMAITLLALLFYDINMPIIAALLTVLGYSINDKIVVLDRIRERAPLLRRQGFVELVNVCTNEMLSRTLLTSMAIVSSIVLWVFGGESLKSFAAALTIGVITGTYSSVYIAAPVAYYYDQWQVRRAKRN